MGNFYSIFNKNKKSCLNEINKNNFIELLDVINEINDLLHFYKTFTDLNTYPLFLPEYKIFSEKCLDYFKNIKNINEIDYDINKDFKNCGVNTNINSFIDIGIIISNIKNDYESINSNIKRKEFIHNIFLLLHVTIFLFIEYFITKNDC